MQPLRIAGRKKHSSVNGSGIRYVLFLQGCTHNCPGCQNPETHVLEAGELTDTDMVIKDILSVRYLDGVTLSGGEPLMQPQACLEIVSKLHDCGINIWLYTGWTWEQICSGDAGDTAIEILSYIDVLVDGLFIETLKSDQVVFRGSTNQRLIDVPASMACGQIITYIYTT